MDSFSPIFIHPEARIGEIFFSNCDSRAFSLLEFNTKRLGTIAYDGNGNKSHKDNWFPVFISIRELRSMDSNLKILRNKFREQIETVLK